MEARFPEGTFDRIASVLDEGEDRTDLIRTAVERELNRRERLRGVGTKPEPSAKSKQSKTG